MEQPAIKLIHECMLDHGMKVFTGPFDMTLGGIRTSDNKSGKFNDFLFASMFTQRGGIMSAIIEGTTDAGLFYRENPINTNGTAIVQHGIQHRGCLTYMEKGGHKGQEAFRQTGTMTYWRDVNRDKYLDFDGPDLVGIYNTNIHDMGERGEDVGKWSAGCGGAVKKNMDMLYYMARLQKAHGPGDKFSYALLHENMF